MDWQDRTLIVSATTSPMTTRAWFRIHSFTGVITGLLLFVICWSGTFTVISYEIDWLVTPEARVEVRQNRASWQAIYESVAAAFPDTRIHSLHAPNYRGTAARVFIDMPAQSSVTVFVDPYTANIRGTQSSLDAQYFLRMFHYTLFQGDFGFYLVCAFAITMLVSLVAALMFFGRWWRRFLKLPRGRGLAFWSELHKTAGLWSIWFLIVIGITGLWYLIEWLQYEAGIGKLSFVGTESAYSVHTIAPLPGSEDGRSLLLDDLIARVHAIRPDLEIRAVRFEDGGMLYVDGQASHLLVRDRANQLYLDRRTGAVLYKQTPQDYSLYWRWTDTADPLHFGDFGGLWSKVVWFVFGLVLSGLILTGTWLHTHRLARSAEGSARHRWPGTMAAILVSVGVVAASVPYGLGAAREFGPVIDGVRQMPELAPGVAAFIIGWGIVTLLIIVAWVILLWRCGGKNYARPPLNP